MPSSRSVLEAGLFYVGGNFLQSGDVGELFLGDAQPAEPFAFIGAGPERGVALPQAADLFVLFPIVARGGKRPRKRTRQFVGLPI